LIILTPIKTRLSSVIQAVSGYLAGAAFYLV